KKASVQMRVAQHATTPGTRTGSTEIDWQPARFALRPKVGPAKDAKWRGHGERDRASALAIQPPERPRDHRRAAAASCGLILRRCRGGTVDLEGAELVRLDEIVHVPRLHLLPLRAVDPDVDATALRVPGTLNHLTVVLRRDAETGR